MRLFGRPGRPAGNGGFTAEPGKPIFNTTGHFRGGGPVSGPGPRGQGPLGGRGTGLAKGRARGGPRWRRAEMFSKKKACATHPIQDAD